jgi:hypothetical protein
MGGDTLLSWSRKYWGDIYTLISATDSNIPGLKILFRCYTGLKKKDTADAVGFEPIIFLL